MFFLPISFENLVLDKVPVPTCVLLSVNYQHQTVSGWTTIECQRFLTYRISLFLFPLTGLFALSINHSNSYLAYPGSATSGEIIVYDVNSLVRLTDIREYNSIGLSSPKVNGGLPNFNVAQQMSFYLCIWCTCVFV